MTGPALSPPPPAAGPWPGRLAWLVLLLAALVRAPHVIMPQLDADMAMWGVQALEIMQGRWHFLFSGELFGGNLEAWLAVPLFWLLGAGPEVLALVPTLLSLLMVWLVWRLGRRELGGWGGLMAMAWAGLAPYYLVLQCVEPKGGYIEVPLFTVLAFALTLRLLRALRAGTAGAGLASLGLGLVWGLGLWCHLLMLPTLLACGLFLLLHQPRIIWSRPGLLWGWRRQIFSRGGGPGALPRLCLVFVVVYVAVWLFSGAYSQGTWRHLSPLYAALPFIFGAALSLLASRRQLAALACAGLLLGLHLWGAWQMTPLLRPGEWDNHQERRRQESELFARLERDGHRHVYAQWFWDALPLTLAAKGALTFADQVENHLPSLARLADADPNPAYVYTTRAEDLAKSLALAGVTCRTSNIGRFTVFDRFGQAGPALQEISPQGWQSPTPGASDAWDRNLSTRWTPGTSQRPGQEFILDLGRVQPGLCRVVLMPAHLYDAPQSLELLLSEDGQHWRPAIMPHHGTLIPLAWSLDRPLMPFQPARTQITFAPQAARYLRFIQKGVTYWWWSVAEVMIFQQAEDPSAGASPTPAQLASAPEVAQAPGPVYAPPEVLALLPEKVRGLKRPQLPPKGGLHLRRLDLATQPGAVLCLPAVNWPASREILAGRLAQEPTVRVMGDWVLVSGLQWPPPAHQVLEPPALAQLYCSREPALAVRTLDNSPLVRWRSPTPQQAGQALRLDLGQPQNIAGLVLTNEHWPGDQPRGLKVEVSGDGQDWQEPEGLAIQSGKVIWGGDRLLVRDGYLRITFAPRPVSQVRLTLTQSHPRRHWSIGHLRLLAPR
ncbi:MAG: discoidin domain-containing protein [Desulfarculus sp.]|nr:discoidin domain-containing protein [Desulfarculus sp.]